MGIDGVRDNFVQSLDDTEWGISSNMQRLYGMVKSKDLTVYQVLERQQLKPEFFAFRWLTLLLSQEFELPGIKTHFISISIGSSTLSQDLS